VAQLLQPKQEVLAPVLPGHRAEAPAATLSQPQLLPQSRAPTEVAAQPTPSLPESAAGKQPASSRPANSQPADLEPAARSVRPSGPPHTPVSQPVVKVEAGQPAAGTLQPGHSAAREAAAMQQRSGGAAPKRQASSLDMPTGQALQRKRQRAGSPAVVSRLGTQAIGAPDAAAVLPSSTRRMLPGCQRLMEGAPAAGLDVAARVVAHCIDAPADRVLPTRCQCTRGCASMSCAP
jgi:hypothetical protein